MSKKFNPYREWLGIPEDEKSPNYYQLLGLQAFESDSEVISRASDRVMMYVRTFQNGEHSSVSQKILNKLSKARVTLLSAELKKKYDQQLRLQLASNVSKPVAGSSGTAIPGPPCPVLSIPCPPIPGPPIPQAVLSAVPIPVPVIPQAVPIERSKPGTSVPSSGASGARQADSPFGFAGFPSEGEGAGLPRSGASYRAAGRNKPQKTDPTTLFAFFIVVLLLLLLVLLYVFQSGDERQSGVISPLPVRKSLEPEVAVLPEAQPLETPTGDSESVSKEKPAPRPDAIKPPKMVASDFNALIATAGQDGKVRLWIPRSGKQIRAMTSDQSDTNCVAFSPDGQMLLSGGKDQMVRLWNVMDGKLVQDFVGHAATITDLSFSPTEKKLLSASLDGSICVWESDFGVLLKTLRHTGSPILTATWSPDGLKIAAGSEDGRVCIWDAQTGKPEKELLGHNGPIRCLQYRPDQKILVSGSNDGFICIWDCNTGENLKKIRPKLAQTQGLAFSPDGSRLAACGQSELIQIYACSEFDRPAFTVHAGRVNLTSIDWSADGRYILTSGQDGVVCLFDASNGDPLGTLQTRQGAINEARFYNEKLGSEL